MSGTPYLVLLYKYGVELTCILQTKLEFLAVYFLWMSKLFEPKYSYLFFAPLWMQFHRRSGIQLLWTATFAEWITLLLKWVFFGDRPYWWVKEHGKEVYGYLGGVPPVKQFQITCDPAPGTPSGHTIINTAVLYIFIDGIILRMPQNKKRLPLSVILWVIYGFVISSVMVSRVFLACHFPHQVVAGFFTGMLIRYVTSKIPVLTFSLTQHLFVSFGMCVVALATYFIVLDLAGDPHWSIALAEKWCIHREWVHPHKYPLFMVFRYVGTMIGIGFALNRKMFPYAEENEFNSLLINGIQAIISVAISIYIGKMIPVSFNFLAVYCSALIVHIFVPILIIGIVPVVTRKVISKMKRD